MPGPLLEVVTPPAAEPVTLADLKAHLRIDWADEDAQLTQFVAAARQMFERKAGRVVLPTVVRERLAGWPESRLYCLQAAPVLSVQSVVYRDPADADVTLGLWRCQVPAEPATLRFRDSLAYPALHPEYPRPVAVTYTAGWADAAAVPEVVKAAIRLLAGHYYANREAYTAGGSDQRAVPFGFTAVCDHYWTGLDWGA